MGSSSKMDKEELHKAYSSSIIRTGKMGRTCSAHGEKKNHKEFWRESQKERDHYEDLVVGL
jgi:hypothetical protein